LLFCLAPLFSLFAAYPLHGQEHRPSCQGMQYEHRNQIDYTLRIAVVAGVAKDVQGSEIRGACVGIFAGKGDKLIAATETTEDGHFEIEGAPNGTYRLVVTAEGLCPANAIVILKNKSRKKKRLAAVMKPSGIDDCSWLELR
jgi:protein-disulfide isomerase